MIKQAKVTKVEIGNPRTGETIDITEHVQAISYSIKTYPRGFSLPNAPTDPRTQARLSAAIKLTCLRLQASTVFGQRSEEWVQSQMTDADRAALAKDVTQ